MQCAVCSVQCAVCNVQCSMCSGECDESAELCEAVYGLISLRWEERLKALITCVHCTVFMYNGV